MQPAEDANVSAQDSTLDLILYNLLLEMLPKELCESQSLTPEVLQAFGMPEKLSEELEVLDVRLDFQNALEPFKVSFLIKAKEEYRVINPELQSDSQIRTFDGDPESVSSILKQERVFGQLTPVEINYNTSSGEITIVVGNKRWRVGLKSFENDQKIPITRTTFMGLEESPPGYVWSHIYTDLSHKEIRTLQAKRDTGHVTADNLTYSQYVDSIHKDISKGHLDDDSKKYDFMNHEEKERAILKWVDKTGGVHKVHREKIAKEILSVAKTIKDHGIFTYDREPLARLIKENPAVLLPSEHAIDLSEAFKKLKKNGIKSGTTLKIGKEGKQKDVAIFSSTRGISTSRYLQSAHQMRNLCMKSLSQKDAKIECKEETSPKVQEVWFVIGNYNKSFTELSLDLERQKDLAVAESWNKNQVTVDYICFLVQTAAEKKTGKLYAKKYKWQESENKWLELE